MATYEDIRNIFTRSSNNPPSVLPTTSYTLDIKNHFVEWFGGKELDDRWNETQSGTGTFAMSDSVNGGFTLYPASSNTNYAQINFNNKRPFAHNASVMISVWKQPANNGGASTVGMCNSAGLSPNSWNKDYYGTRLWTTDTHYKLRTADASTVTESANSDVARNTNFNVFRWESTSSNVIMSVNGGTSVTKTTNLPTAKLQPILMSWNENGNRDYLHVSYVEAWNT